MNRPCVFEVCYATAITVTLHLRIYIHNYHTLFSVRSVINPKQNHRTEIDISVN